LVHFDEMLHMAVAKPPPAPAVAVPVAFHPVPCQIAHAFLDCRRIANSNDLAVRLKQARAAVRPFKCVRIVKEGPATRNHRHVAGRGLTGPKNSCPAFTRGIFFCWGLALSPNPAARGRGPLDTVSVGDDNRSVGSRFLGGKGGQNGWD
jgi:hypothetical protein